MLNETISGLGILGICIIDVIKGTPNVIWSAIIAALVTWYGIGRNIRHDIEQRKIQRELDLKRAVYLEAIDSISKGIHRISSIPSINVGEDLNQISNGIEPEIASALKVLMVGSNETFEKGSELINLMNEKLLYLIFMSSKIYFFEQKFKIEMGFLTNEVEKLLKQANLGAQKYQKKMELLTEVTKSVEEINQKALGVIISIRKELNLAVDEKSIFEIGRKNVDVSRTLIKKSQENMAKELTNFLEFVGETTKKNVHSEQESICEEDAQSPSESKSTTE